MVTEPVNELSEFRGNRRFSRKSATCPCFVELEGFHRFHENLPLVPVRRRTDAAHTLKICF